MDLSPHQSTPRNQSVKRRRVALACDACRTRKSKCDGSRPKCGMCKDLGFDCAYTPPVTATNVIVQKDYLKDLELRVKSLEDNLVTVKSDLSGLTSHMNRSSPSYPLKEIESQHRDEPSPDFVGTEDTVDAMGAVAFADEKDCGFFGASSNIAFLRHLSRAVAHSESTQKGITSPTTDHITHDGGFASATRPPSPSLGQISEALQERPSSMFTLPSSEETLTLIHRYFGDTGLLFPYIHPPTFFDTYYQLKNNSKRVRRTWLGLLNIILAMAKLTLASGRSPAETCISESAVYYRRALDLCKGEILRGTTLEVVQYLLLMGQYLQGTQKSVQAWTIHGLAVKAALQLGLHSKDASKAFPPLEQETRKRTWFGCVVLDRTLGMTFGRPAAIPDCYVQLDLPAFQGITEVIPTADHDEVRHSIQFFNNTITLYKQMASIIDQIYGQNLGCGPPLPVGETVSRILGIENQLFCWVMALPECLRQVTVEGMRDEIEQSQNQPQLFPLKFRVILTLRYLHIQILLHRPILVKFLDATRASGIEPVEDRLLNDIGYSSMKKCIESATGIIDIISELVSSSGWPRELLGAWWYSLYYTFNAALVIIGATWVHRTRQSGKGSASICANIHIYPSRAVETLYKLDTGNRMVDRCRYYLEELMFALRLKPEDMPDQPNMGFPVMETSTPNVSFPSFGIECGEFMLDDLFMHRLGFERW
ncbi:putative C6 transcription factor [Aspergillus ruber CBS 135680]|uniref:C6 transcription factor n=1 Tax=Aspergillus ruber (strain CBS 135680) TaxID=1388766 RepID=A0A017S0V1_ASPRC|nr:C6 transcription factor [Aspergillus ruber CBS 135680]EYE90663.1 C6 transcription factor [Aspergillus ruber CBS 135680]